MDKIIEFIAVLIVILSIVGVIIWLSFMADDSKEVAAKKEVTDKMASLNKSIPEQLSLGCMVFTYDGLQGTKLLRAFSFEKPSIVKILWKDISKIEYSLMEDSIYLDVYFIQSRSTNKKVIRYYFDAFYAQLTDLKVVVEKYSSQLSGKPVPLIQHNTFLNG